MSDNTTIVEVPNKLVKDSDLRAQIYVAAAAVGSVLISLGYIDQTELDGAMQLAGSLVLVAGLVLARLNKPKKTVPVEPEAPVEDADPSVQYPTRAARHAAEGEDI